MIRSVNVKKEKRKTAERFENLHSTDPLATSSKIPAPSYLKIYTSSSDVSLLLPNCRWQMVWLSSSSSSSSKKTKAGFAGKYRWTDWRKQEENVKSNSIQFIAGVLFQKWDEDPGMSLLDRKMKNKCLWTGKWKKSFWCEKSLWYRKVNKKSFWYENPPDTGRWTKSPSDPDTEEKQMHAKVTMFKEQLQSSLDKSH